MDSCSPTTICNKLLKTNGARISTTGCAAFDKRPIGMSSGSAMEASMVSPQRQVQARRQNAKKVCIAVRVRAAAPMQWAILAA